MTHGGPLVPERRPRTRILASLLLLSAALGHAQLADRLSVRGAVEAMVPVFGDEQFFTTGVRGALAAGVAVLPFLQPFVTAGFASQPLRGSDLISISEAGLGAALMVSPLERLELRVEGVGGLYAAYRGDLGAGGPLLSARGEVGFRVSPSLSISARGGIARYFGPGSPLLTAATVGLSATLHVGGLAFGGGRLRIEDVQVGSVYPVFYSWYDDNSFGAVSLVNAEKYDARDVRVSYSVGRYMAQPKQCASFPSIAPGGSVHVSLNALFTDEVLSLTESTRAPGVLIVDYSVLGSRREVRAPFTQRFFHRNAMNWDDDRKAAAFVSPTDPAALWFAKYVSGIVRRRARSGVSLDLQLAMGLLETERLFGIAYVVDPNSSYVEKSADESAVDYLQFPHQTLFYRGGDCDDLSILFTALLESVGVRTAFITIPGHIFMAFKLQMSEAEARAAFFDPSLLIFRDGEAWVPVEITMVKEGFVKAWRIGAKEWADNAKAGTAAFLPMQESWPLFPPVGIPDVNPRFSLPDEALVIQGFDESVDRFVAREIDPAVQECRARAGGADSPLAANELGILYGRYGLLKEAWNQFSLTAKSPLVFGWTNLGSVAFLRGDYELALTYYQWALGLDPLDTAATLGVARSQYELERFEESGVAYAGLRELDPALARKYGYLASAMGGDGRAWSFSDRLTTTVWDEPARVAAAPPAVAVVASAPPVEPAPAAPPPVEAPPVVSAPVKAHPVALAPMDTLPVQAPPRVAAELPKDADLLAVAVIEPEPEPGHVPVPAPAPEPTPAPAPEPASRTCARAGSRTCTRTRAGPSRCGRAGRRITATRTTPVHGSSRGCTLCAISDRGEPSLLCRV